MFVMVEELMVEELMVGEVKVSFAKVPPPVAFKVENEPVDGAEEPIGVPFMLPPVMVGALNRLSFPAARVPAVVPITTW